MVIAISPAALFCACNWEFLANLILSAWDFHAITGLVHGLCSDRVCT